LHEKEQQLFEALNLQEAKIFSSPDEPLFKYFGSDAIIALTKKTPCRKMNAYNIHWLPVH